MLLGCSRDRIWGHFCDVRLKCKDKYHIISLTCENSKNDTNELICKIILWSPKAKGEEG